MIWFFLSGWIAGAVAMVMYANHWMRTHVKNMTAEEFLDELEKAGYPDGDGAGDREEQAVSEPEGDADGTDRVGSASGQRVEDTEQGQGTEDG